MTSLRLAAASIAAGASLITFTAPNANAQSFVSDVFGVEGACDSAFVDVTGVGSAAGRDCRKARKFAAKEAANDRRHDRTSQLIGLGGNLFTSLIQHSQNRKAAESAGPSSAELALMQQQHELELMKLQLQLQAQQQQARPVYGKPSTVNYVTGYPQPTGAYPQPTGAYPQSYGPYPAQPVYTY